MDFDDIPMDNVPTLSEQDEAALAEQMRIEQEAASIHIKSEQDIQLDCLNQLLTTCKLNSWEKGFCESCQSWLQKSVNSKLSYKQRDVLTKVFEKYSPTA